MSTDLDEPVRTVLKEQLKKLQEAARLMKRSSPPPDMPVRVLTLISEVIDRLKNLVQSQVWPEPTSEAPDMETLIQWLVEDGVVVSITGPHGSQVRLLMTELEQVYQFALARMQRRGQGDEGDVHRREEAVSRLAQALEEVRTPLKQSVEKALGGGPTSAYELHDMPGFVAIVVDSASFLNLIHLQLLRNRSDGLGIVRQYVVVENYETQGYLLLVGKKRAEK